VVDVILLGAIGFAFVRAWRARFVGGVVLAVLRLVILVGSIFVIGLSLLASNAALIGGPTKLAMFGAGPLVSFATAFITWRRMRNVPYLEEEAASKVFMPWVAIACVDAVGVALIMFGVAIANWT
jgi:hypothetical protein